MSDAKRVFYKTPIQRFLEILVIFVFTLGASLAFHWLCPDVKLGYPVVACFAIAWLGVPLLGSRLIQTRGGLSISRESLTRRYLNEMGPVAFKPPGSLLNSGGGWSRRPQSQGLFRE